MRAGLSARFRWVVGSLALVVLAVMGWIALVYTGPVPTFAMFGEWNDKALHVGAFAMPAALVVLPGPAPRALLALAVFAAVLELVQLAFPLRQASLADLAASVAGVIAGWAIGVSVRTSIARMLSRAP